MDHRSDIPSSAGTIRIEGGSVKITHKNETKSAASPETLDRLREWLAFREYAETEEQIFFTPPKDADIVFSGNDAASTSAACLFGRFCGKILCKLHKNKLLNSKK